MVSRGRTPLNTFFIVFDHSWFPKERHFINDAFRIDIRHNYLTEPYHFPEALKDQHRDDWMLLDSGDRRRTSTCFPLSKYHVHERMRMALWFSSRHVTFQHTVHSSQSQLKGDGADTSREEQIAPSSLSVCLIMSYECRTLWIQILTHMPA